MKDFEKLLQSSKKLEERQTARKAKEINEIYLFNLQRECYKKCELDRILEIDQAHAKCRNLEIEGPVIAERECLESKVGEFLEVEEFENQTQDIQISPPNSSGEQPHILKQLPAGSPDAFTHELTDLTETQLQRELTQNEMAINGSQEDSEEEEEIPGTVFFFRPTKIRAK
jgi:hypothetical protein